MSLDALSDIVAFVLPGYVGMRVYTFLVRTRKRDDFERIAVSLLFSLGAYLLLTLAFPDSWCKVDTSHWWFVLLLFLIASLFGYGLARLATWPWLREWLQDHKVDYSPHPSVWHEIWQCPQQGPWARVRLKDGSEYYGQVHKYSTDPDQETAELWLYPVAEINEEESESAQETEGPEIIEGVSVYLAGDEITSIEAYRPGATDRKAAEN